ncbi:MAG: hypothetical protein HYY97_15500 [Rhodocyclales bacterium]|nr:hypothetical protein [Rhodocyclales bacterium]
MNSPYRQRQLLSFIAGLLLAASAAAQAPAAGRYRCYELPGYAVLAWFDLAGAEISVNGDTPRTVRIDAARQRIELPRGLLAPYRHGFWFAPGAGGGDAERVTIVLAARADARPDQRRWATLPRCYLTTH